MEEHDFFNRGLFEFSYKRVVSDVCTTKLMSSSEPLAETSSVAKTATITADVVVADPNGEITHASGDSEATASSVLNQASKTVRVGASLGQRQGLLAKLPDNSEVDSLAHGGVKLGANPKARKNSGSDKIAERKDEISEPAQVSEEAKNDYFSAAQNQVIEAFGENPYTTWRNDKIPEQTGFN